MNKQMKTQNQNNINNVNSKVGIKKTNKLKNKKNVDVVTTKQNIAIGIIIFLALMIVYFTIVIIRFCDKPTDTVLIKRGEVINHEEAYGYIIREEEVIDNSAYDGIIKSEVEEATRVAKGSEVVTYVSKSEQQLIDKIAKLDEKIDKAIESKQTIYPNDVKILESEIENNIYTNIKGNTDLKLIKENKKTLNEKIMKKAKIVGELSPAGSELKNLITERAKYESEINNSQKILLAPKSGLVSYRVDGLENVLTFNSLSKLTTKNLSNMKIVLNQVVPLSQNKIKIINNFYCYVAVPLKSKEAQNANLDDTVYLRFKNDSDVRVPATIDYISKEDDRTLLIFKVTTNVEELTKYRKIDVDVIWWSSTGLKLNKDAIFYTTIASSGSGETSKDFEQNNENLADINSIQNVENNENQSNLENTKKEEQSNQEIQDEQINLQEQMGQEEQKNGNDEIRIETIRIKKAYSTVDVFVKIIKETDDFVIIDNYKDSELIEKGIDEATLKGRTTMKMYDEVLILEDKK